jgi:hypothetical protein
MSLPVDPQPEQGRELDDKFLIACARLIENFAKVAWQQAYETLKESPWKTEDMATYTAERCVEARVEAIDHCFAIAETPADRKIFEYLEQEKDRLTAKQEAGAE